MPNTAATPPPPPAPTHIALLPSAGMGHLTPFLRIASMLASRNCRVTLITVSPSVSAAESSHISFFLSQHPKVNHIEFQVIPFKSTNPADDPFFLQFHATNSSVHLLSPALAAASPPLSAIFSDFGVASGIAPVAASLGIPNYIISTTSCKFFSLMAYLPTLLSNPLSFSSNEVNIPGITPIPIRIIPPPFKNPNHIFTSLIAINAQALSNSKGIIMNTFDDFESETLAAIKTGKVSNNLPPILPIGPLETFEAKKDKEQDQNYRSWLDSQSTESVVYVSFGSRTAMSPDQIRELAKGLERSGCGFLWVLKTSKVDKEDTDEVEDLLGKPFLERTKNQGVVVKGWVSQQDILEHAAVGGFVNHCGWNSVMEAARRGIPVLAWPQHGDQSVNAEVVEKAGLGIWERKWGRGLEGVVGGEEIGEKIVELMKDEKLRGLVRKVGENARRAIGVGGRSEKVLNEVLENLTQKNN